MNKQDYQEYLQSRHWKTISDETKRLADYRCQVCYSGESLHTHHRTYERVGDELQSDLTCLCGKCHALFHGKVDSPRERELAEDFSYNDSPIPFLAVAPEPVPPTNREPYRIVISMFPSGDEDRDKRRVKNAFGMLSSIRGDDTFAFKVYEASGASQLIEFPEERTRITEEVLNRVSKLIGSLDYEITPIREGVVT